jgi:hypothetical protein
MKGSILLQILGGLAIGLALGLLIAWVLAPVQYTDTSPSSLRMEFKAQYRAAIASAFNATHNLDRARARLALLEDPDPAKSLVVQAQQIMASGGSPDSAFEIAELVNALNAQIPTTGPVTSPTSIVEQATKPVGTATPFGMVSTPKASPTSGPSPTSRPTATQIPTSTPSPTQGAPFIIISKDEVCDSNLQPGLLMVEVRNKKHQPIAGQELVITWSDGQENFFTGLKPEISDGYADFQMQRDTLYSIHLASGGEPANGLSAPVCNNKDGGEYLGGIKLVFQQP